MLFLRQFFNNEQVGIGHEFIEKQCIHRPTWPDGEGEYEDSPETAQHQEMLDKLEEYDARYASQTAAAASDQAHVDAANAPKQS